MFQPKVTLWSFLPFCCQRNLLVLLQHLFHLRLCYSHARMYITFPVLNYEPLEVSCCVKYVSVPSTMPHHCSAVDMQYILIYFS